MKHNRYLSVALIVLLVLSAMPLAASAVSNKTVAGHPNLSASTPTNEFTPGSEVKLPLYVQNDGVITQGGAAQYEQRVKTARATTLDISAGSNPIKVNTKQYPAGDLGPGSQGPFPLDITIPEGTKPGTYYLTVHAHYKYTAEINYNPQQPQYINYQDEQTFRVPVIVKNRATFSVINSSTNAQVGQRGTYNVTVKNTGSEIAKHVTAQVSSGTAGLTFGSSGQSASTSVSSWKPDQTKTLTYSAAVADTTNVHNYSVPLSLTFADSNGVTRQANRLVSTLRPKPEQTFDIQNVNSTLQIGRNDGKLSGTVVNTGPTPVHGATLVLQHNGSGLSFNQAGYALPNLQPGQSAHFSFHGGTVPQSVNASSIPLSLAVQYNNPQNDRYTSDSHQVSLPVRPNKNLFTISAANSIPSGTRGNTPKDSNWSPLTLQVTNNGKQTMHNVRPSLDFTTQYYQRPIESNQRTSVIKTLKPGQTKNVTYAVSASSASAGTTYPLDVQVSYQNPSGVKRTTSDYTVPIDIATGSSLPLLPIGGGAVILIGILLGAFIWWRRDPEEE